MSKLALRKKSQTNWGNLAVMPDSAIDFSDSPELDTAFFENAELRLPKPKKAVSLRLDDDILNWFRRQGKGYQTRINAVLRLYMQAHTRTPSRSLKPAKPEIQNSKLKIQNSNCNVHNQLHREIYSSSLYKSDTHFKVCGSGNPLKSQHNILSQ